MASAEECASVTISGDGAAANLPATVTQLQARSDARETLPADAAVSAARILLVDDHAINRKVVQLFLRPFGFAITEAHDGAQALRRLAEQAFDLVLMDVHMPNMGGCEAVKRIRESGEPWACVPVIALTGDAMPGDQQRYLMAGMDGYVAKPIGQQGLLNAIAHVLEARPARAAA